MIELQEHVPLNEFTTIRLGGAAKYFTICRSVEDIKEALSVAQSKGLRTHVLGGGSNTIFSDNGFDGLVIKVDLAGKTYRDEGDAVYISAGAGEQWESFVSNAVEKGYSGIECLSGIPGSVGATPIQNVGAYGQEVKETIRSVKVLDRISLKETVFTNSDCNFSYRTSRFKTFDAGKYIVTEVMFRLTKNGRPTIHYPEVKRTIDASIDLSVLADGAEVLRAVRSVVLSLRRKKSMVIDPGDPNSRSVGSFFLNPIVDNTTLKRIQKIWEEIGDGSPVPKFPFGNEDKIPAAWLIERSGFTKGYKVKGVGISDNHTLALVNYHGTTVSLMELAGEIQRRIFEIFQIQLALEANVVS